MSKQTFVQTLTLIDYLCEHGIVVKSEGNALAAVLTSHAPLTQLALPHFGDSHCPPTLSGQTE